MNEAITNSEAFRVARELCDDGGHPEYVRACAEMVCDLTGSSMDEAPGVIQALTV